MDITKTGFFGSVESRGDFSFFVFDQKYLELLIIVINATAETEDALLRDIIGDCRSNGPG
jgi:DUF1009 family protein